MMRVTRNTGWAAATFPLWMLTSVTLVPGWA